MLPVALLGEWLLDARERSVALLNDLNDEQLMGPRLEQLTRCSGN